MPDDRNRRGLAVIHPNDYLVTEDDVITDVDLDVEEVRLKDGRRLTEELAEQLSDQTLAEARRRNLVPVERLSGDGDLPLPRWWSRVPFGSPTARFLSSCVLMDGCPHGLVAKWWAGWW